MVALHRRVGLARRRLPLRAGSSESTPRAATATEWLRDSGDGPQSHRLAAGARRRCACLSLSSRSFQRSRSLIFADSQHREDQLMTATHTFESAVQGQVTRGRAPYAADDAGNERWCRFSGIRRPPSPTDCPVHPPVDGDEPAHALVSRGDRGTPQPSRPRTASREGPRRLSSERPHLRGRE